MSRRQLLKSVGGLLLAPALVSRAWAQAVPKVGICLPFTSVQSEVAQEMRAGYQLAFDRSAASGFEAKPVWADDESKPELTNKLIAGFASDPNVIAATGIVGTPHAKAALPTAQHSYLPIVGIRSGADELRTGERGVYHLRASFGDEVARMVAMVHGAAMERLAVVYSDDAFGKAVMERVSKEAEFRGLRVVAQVAAERNGRDVEGKVSQALKGGNADALLLLMISKPMLAGLKHARENLKYINPVVCMSFCATKYLAESLDHHLAGLGLVSAFPIARLADIGAAREFREHADPKIVNSLTAQEAFVYGSVLLGAVRRAHEPTRQGLVDALRRPLQVGRPIGETIAFNGAMVGRQYLAIVHKGSTGPLRA